MWPFKFAMRRKRGLPHMVLYLLSSSPKNGMELRDGVESNTRGGWRPTPGSIYPLLKELSDQGIIKKREDGRYELTQKGRSQSDVPLGPRSRRAPTMDEMMGQMNSYVSYMEDAKASNQEDMKPHTAALQSLAMRLSKLTAEEPDHSE